MKTINPYADSTSSKIEELRQRWRSLGYEWITNTQYQTVEECFESDDFGFYKEAEVLQQHKYHLFPFGWYPKDANDKFPSFVCNTLVKELKP